MEALRDGRIDMVFHASQNPYIAEQDKLSLSNTAWTFTTAAIATQGSFNEDGENTVAMAKDNLTLEWYISYNYPQWTILKYDTEEDALKAVREGEADCLVVRSGRVTDFMQDNKLRATFLTKPDDISFAVQRGNTTLLTILNKTLKPMPDAMLTGALSSYDAASRKVTVTDFVKDNLPMVAGTAIAVFALIIAITLVFLRRATQAATQAQKLNRKLQESQRATQMALSRAESANAAKTTFLSNVSHDIRTPMNAIVGITTLMEHDKDDPQKLERYIGKVQSSSKHLLSLINDVLDMSRIESGEIELNQDTVSIVEQVQQVDGIIRQQVDERDQTLRTDIQGVTHEFVVTDGLRLRQALLNLLSNAVKYTPVGGRIDFTLAELPCESPGRASYRIVVEDTGCGMTPEFLEHIYEPFTRAENSTTNKVQGTGLGMAITKNIVDMMGGTIDIQSEPGRGSRFEVRLALPIDENADRTVAGDAGNAAPTGSALRGKRFLCAEDNELNAEILKAILEMEGADCTIYPNGSELVKAFASVSPGAYDAILMDMQMPVMDGIEAAKAIRNGENPLGRTIPIIAMTANAFAEDVRRCLDAGMDAHIAKPLDVGLLERTLKNLTGQKPAEGDNAEGDS